MSEGPALRGRLRDVLAAGAGAAAGLVLCLAPTAAAGPGTPSDPAAAPSAGPVPGATDPVAPSAPLTVAPEGTADPAEAPAPAVPQRSGAHPESPAASGGPVAAGPGADLAVSASVRPAAGTGPAGDGAGTHAGAGSPSAPPGDPAVMAAVRETFDYAVTVTNRGPSAARKVVVTDRLPASLEFVSSRDGCTADGRTVRCGPLAALPVGGVHTWVVTVRLAAGYDGDGSDVVNEAVVGAETADPDPSNNQTSLTGLTIPPNSRIADLSLAKTALLGRGRTVLRPGDKFTYRITVHNQGPATARGVRVTDLLPEPLVLLSSPDDCVLAPPTRQPEGEGRPEAAAQERLVVCPERDRLAAGESAEFRITVRVASRERTGTPKEPCTPVDNIARVTSASFDPDPSDNANRPGTTGPGGKPLCLGREGGHEGEHGGGHDGSGDGGHQDGSGDGHHGRGDLADSGAGLPGWLPWTAGGLAAAGCALRAAAGRRARRAGSRP
ncbi:hypothetical protein [Streptomyces bambusae]